MNAKDLRIGNFVNDENGITQIQLGDFYNMEIDRNCPYNPIPLTEEWLLKFGFRQIDKYSFAYKGFFIHKRKIGFKYSKKLIINSVYQLQNLYFALTNEELTIK